MNPCDSSPFSTAPYYRETRVTLPQRQTACRMWHCCARRIDRFLGRRKLGCTPTRWAERHPQGVCRIRKAAEPPTAAQQRMIGAEANRIAASNAAPPRYGQCNRQALQLFELPACNGNFLWEGEREGYLFSKKRYPSLIRTPAPVQGICKHIMLAITPNTGYNISLSMKTSKALEYQCFAGFVLLICY